MKDVGFSLFALYFLKCGAKILTIVKWTEKNTTMKRVEAVYNFYPSLSSWNGCVIKYDLSSWLPYILPKDYFFVNDYFSKTNLLSYKW